MKRILLLVAVFTFFTANIFAEQRARYSAGCHFDENDMCKECQGKGKLKNPDYSRKKMGSKKILMCRFCNGTGKKPRKIDGKLLVTRNYQRYKNYTIKSIDSKGITIIFSVYGNKEKEALIKPQLWPKHLQKSLAEKLYLDSNEKMYILEKLPNNIKLDVGDAFLCTGTPSKNTMGCWMSLPRSQSLVFVNQDKVKLLKAGYQQKMAVLIVGKKSSYSFNAEILSKPTNKQLVAYFNGNKIK
jgi:hypothetical protein